MARACGSEGEVWDHKASLSSSRNLKLFDSFATGKIEKMIEEVDKAGSLAESEEEELRAFLEGWRWSRGLRGSATRWLRLLEFSLLFFSFVAGVLCNDVDQGRVHLVLGL